MQIKGRDVTTGLPTEIEVTSEETLEALSDSAEAIVEGVHSILEITPPELLSDISARGIYITGGGGLVSGLDRLIQERTGIPVMIAEDSISCVAMGTGKALSHVELLETGNAIKIKKF
jgi:rod shape-determining protein MreB